VGGLAAGIALWLRECHPAGGLVGAGPATAAGMRAALARGARVRLARFDTFVDGAAVGQVGALTFPIVRDLFDEVVAVPAGAVCTERPGRYQAVGIIAEPAGGARQLRPAQPMGNAAGRLDRVHRLGREQRCEPLRGGPGTVPAA